MRVSIKFNFYRPGGREAPQLPMGVRTVASMDEAIRAMARALLRNPIHCPPSPRVEIILEEVPDDTQH